VLEDEIIVTNRQHPTFSWPWHRPAVASLPAAAALLGLVAALIHAWVVREHLAHWWGYGVFFAVVAVAQAAAAVLLYGRPSRRLLVGVIAANAGLIVLYIVSRTVGTPFLGPHAGHTETVGGLDLAASGAEIAQAALAATFLRRAPSPARPLRLRWMTAALAATSAVAWAAPVGPVHAAPIADVFLPPGIGQAIGEHASHLSLSAGNDAPPAQGPRAEVTEEIAEPTYTPCTPRTADGSVSVPGTEAGAARAVLYADQGDVWLVTLADGKVHRLSVDGFDCGESQAVFRNDSTITFQADGVVYDLDIETGDLTKVVEIESGIGAFAWSPDGNALAYFAWGGETPYVATYDPATKVSRRVRNFEGGGGRCGGMDDEMAVSWSPDGTRIMLVATYFDFMGKTMYVMNRDGTNVVAPRLGTHARWAASNDLIYYREWDGDRRWYSLNLDTAAKTALAMTPGTHHAAVSPDGRMIATTDEDASPSVYLYDTVARTERVLVHGYAAAIWMSSEEIALSKTKACDPEGMECGHGAWMTAGTTAAFDLSGKRLRSLPMTSTIDAVVLLTPEARPTPTPAPTPPSPSPEPTTSPDPTLPPVPVPSGSPTPEPTPTPSGSPPPTPTPSPSAEPAA
jgi:hypothetical protein